MTTKEEILLERLNKVFGPCAHNWSLNTHFTIKEQTGILAAMEEYAAQSKWVDAKTELPEEGELILCFTNKVWPAKYERKEFYRFPNAVEGDRAGNYFYTGVTHWQPLPQIPKP